MKRLRDESGFTLPELLTTMVIAMIVSLAAFALIDQVMKRTGDIGARVDTTQRARNAMEQLTRQLRSQVCAQRSDTSMTSVRSLESASPTSFTAFTDFSNETLDANGLLPAPELRKVAWDSNVLTETVTKGTRRTLDNKVAYSATPAVRPFLTNVVPVKWADTAQTQPVIFRYFRFPTTTPGTFVLPTEEIAKNENRALNETELGSVAKITIDFSVLTLNNKTRGNTTLQTEIYVRTADPNGQTPKPTCLTS